MSFFQKVCPASSMFPGGSVHSAARQIVRASPEAYGKVSLDHMQLCPQHHGVIDEAVCDELMRAFPTTRFRLHANVRLFPKHHFFDASNYGPETYFYFRRAAAISRRLNAPAYTLHAGSAATGTERSVADAIQRLSELFGVPVGVEFLYPGRKAKAPNLFADWASMERWLDTGLPFALDLSHVNIIATKEGRRDDLLLALLSSPALIEVHISGNDGRSDRHLGLASWPWWHDIAEVASPANSACITFTEANQLKSAIVAEVA